MAHYKTSRKRWQATPWWQSKKAIKKIYKECKKLTATTGIAYSVDHIVPLSNKLVCGLHVPWNLRIIPLSENLEKGNSWWPDMPEDL